MYIFNVWNYNVKVVCQTPAKHQIKISIKGEWKCQVDHSIQLNQRNSLQLVGNLGMHDGCVMTCSLPHNPNHQGVQNHYSEIGAFHSNCQWLGPLPLVVLCQFCLRRLMATTRNIRNLFLGKIICKYRFQWIEAQNNDTLQHIALTFLLGL